ncbi:MAG: PfkB family carbohydrate kinase [Bdellovibrionales bacterium]
MDNHLLKKYGHKIKSPKELASLVGNSVPRKKKVIMCHGVFDIVHPGHIRHLIYAKGKADILVVSITADKHISKDVYRPHVPQDLRAVNLAALELVDYVVIDKNETPLENLENIKPDFFAKGFEYHASGLPPKTQQEADILKSYGGEIIFTPGDIVYSSSKLITTYEPNLNIEKLQVLMNFKDIDFDTLKRTVTSLGGRTVHILGDTIVDSFTRCKMIGSQAKTPTMSVLFQDKENFSGGAAVVAKHCRAAGASVHFTTLLGDDELKQFVLDDLRALGIEVNAQIDKKRPTVNKNAIIVDNYRLLKVDTLDNASINEKFLNVFADAVRTTVCDAVVFSDFRHGIFNKFTIPKLCAAIPEGVFRVADSQVASRWGNITEFQGFDLITPNEKEARFALADQDSGIRPLASQLYDKAKCKFLILKLGERGALACLNNDHESLDSFFVLDSFVDRLADPVGAGDALLVYSTLAMLCTSCKIQSTILGVLAASCECEKDGNIPVYPEDVLAKLEHLQKLS